MPRSGSHKQKQVFGEINITPLTDIFLVLLTIMIIVAPFLRQMRSDIRLPEITTGSDVGQKDVTVDVTKDGRYYISGVEIPAEELDRDLEIKAMSQTSKRLVIQADRDTKSGAVLRVFRAAEAAAYEQVTLLGEAASTPTRKVSDEISEPGTVR
jgi:biopolymer transport protein ExbD/biopolymer transport protein TolR